MLAQVRPGRPPRSGRGARPETGVVDTDHVEESGPRTGTGLAVCGIIRHAWDLKEVSDEWHLAGPDPAALFPPGTALPLKVRSVGGGRMTGVSTDSPWHGTTLEDAGESKQKGSKPS